MEGAEDTKLACSMFVSVGAGALSLDEFVQQALSSCSPKSKRYAQHLISIHVSKSHRSPSIFQRSNISNIFHRHPTPKAVFDGPIASNKKLTKKQSIKN